MWLKHSLFIIFINIAILFPLCATTIRNIHIELPASNKSIAREQAFDQARLIAISQYAQLYPADAERINQLQNDSLARSKVIQGVKVIKEKFERQRYTCFLDVTFNPDQLSRFLKPKLSLYSKTSQIKNMNIDKNSDKIHDLKKMLILPIYISEDESLLWEDENVWRTSWQNQEINQENKVTIHYTVPLSDLEDQTTCSIEDVMTERPKNLALICHRYYQQGVIISVLKKLGDSDNYELIVKLAVPNKPVKVFETYHIDNIKNLSNEARFRHAQRLTLRIVTSGSIPDNVEPDPDLKSVLDPVEQDEKVNHQDSDQKNIKVSFANQEPDKQSVINKSTKVDVIKNHDGDTNVKSPAEKLNTSKQVALDPNQNNDVDIAPISTTLSYTAKFSDLKQWQTIRQIIRQTDNVSNFRVFNLSRETASFKFDYDGEIAQLENNLKNKSLKLSGKGQNKNIELISTTSSHTEVINDDISINESLGY